MGHRHRTRGFTLIEIMISMMVFAIVMGALAALHISTARLTESSRNLTQAMNDARVVMEMIRDAAQAGGLTGANGVTGLYREGANLAPALGLQSLQNESITVDYVNPAADPLQFALQVQWLERGRNRSAWMDTTVTRR